MDINKFKPYLFPISVYFILLILLFSSYTSAYLYVFLLGLPLLDSRFIESTLPPNTQAFIQSVAVLLVFTVVLFFVSTDTLQYFLVMTAFTALPEEWFFRGYLLRKLGLNLRANVIVSIGFSILHIIVQGSLIGALTFIPSLVFGWVFIKYKSLAFVILLHALSNFIYIKYVKDFFTNF